MKILNVRLFSIAVLALFMQGSIKSCGIFQVGELAIEQTIAVTTPVTLNVASSGGSVKIEHGPDEKISISMKFRVQAGDRAGAEKLLKRLNEDPPITQVGDKISLGDLDRYALPTGGFFNPTIAIDFMLKIPDGTVINVETKSGDLTVSHAKATVKAELGWGSADVKNFEGELDISTSAGRLNLLNLRGMTKVESVSGSIFAQSVRGDLMLYTKRGYAEIDSEITEGAQWRIESDAGEIAMGLPRDSNFMLYSKTDSGQIKVDFSITTTGLRGDWGFSGLVGKKTETRLELVTKTGKIQLSRK
jgi:hypothetical protein